MGSAREKNRRWQQDFFNSLEGSAAIFSIFDHVPGVSMFIKDVNGHYVMVNQVMTGIFGLSSPDEIIFKTDFDFFPPAIAARYVDEDQRIIDSKQPLLNQRNFMPDNDGFPLWFTYSKFPLFDNQRIVIGVAGIKHSCELLSPNDSSRHGRLFKVVEFVTRRYGEPIEAADLANHVDLSVSQLQREFSRLFGISPNRYVQEVRIGVARNLLKTSDLDMATIANKCGFYDQSHFSRQFKSSTGLSPMKYRQRFLKA